MFARVTLFDIDTMQVNVRDAVEQFKELVVPEMKLQDGYQGSYVLTTGEGRGLLLTLWETEEAAEAGIKSGYYDEQVRKFLAIYRAPPGRENYEVSFADEPRLVG